MRGCCLFLLLLAYVCSQTEFEEAYKKRASVQNRFKELPMYTDPMYADNKAITENFISFLHAQIKIEGFESMKLKRPASIVRKWCIHRERTSQTKCSWHEAGVLLSTLQFLAKLSYDIPEDSRAKQIHDDTNTLHKSMPKQERECRRIGVPTPEQFLALVSKSEPVIIEGALQNWSALHKWDMEYLNQKVGHTEVRYFAADDFRFERVVDAKDIPALYKDSGHLKVRNADENWIALYKEYSIVLPQ